MTPYDLIHKIASDHGVRADVVPAYADPVTYGTHMQAHAETIHEREAAQADCRFMTVVRLQEVRE